MPRIPQLASATSADSNDELPFEDVSASTTKKITKADYLKDTASYLTDNTITAAKIDFTTITNTPISATLQNGWTNFGGGFGIARYVKDKMGFVHLDGVVTRSTATGVILTLPTGYRPATDMYVGTISGTTAAVFSISSTSGTVTCIQGTNNASFSLDCTVFLAA